MKAGMKVFCCSLYFFVGYFASLKFHTKYHSLHVHLILMQSGGGWPLIDFCRRPCDMHMYEGSAVQPLVTKESKKEREPTEEAPPAASPGTRTTEDSDMGNKRKLEVKRLEMLHLPVVVKKARKQVGFSIQHSSALSTAGIGALPGPTCGTSK
jgi:hypothetical protein